MKLTRKELLYLKFATTDIGQMGIFDYENWTDEEFPSWYEGLTKAETVLLAESIRKKVFAEQKKLDAHLATLKKISTM